MTNLELEVLAALPERAVRRSAREAGGTPIATADAPRTGELGRDRPALSRVGIGYTVRARSVRVGFDSGCPMQAVATSFAV
jgi:hypothetical protein